MLEAISYQGNRRLLLSPNRSASWQETKWLMATFAVVVFTIALGWALVGIWVILPFAGAELLLLVFIMYQVSRSTYQWERIDIHPQHIRVSTSKNDVFVFSRVQSHVEFTEDDNDWLLPTITLVDGKNRKMLGAFLNLEDRILLRNALRDRGVMICRNHWWKH